MENCYIIIHNVPGYSANDYTILYGDCCEEVICKFYSESRLGSIDVGLFEKIAYKLELEDLIAFHNAIVTNQKIIEIYSVDDLKYSSDEQNLKTYYERVKGILI